MNNLVEYQLSDGGSIFIEVEENNNTLMGGQPVSMGGQIIRSANEMLNLYAPLVNFAKDFKEKVKDTISDADSITLEFGAKIGADIGCIIAKSQVEANFKVSISWKK
jgi:hypothetical protein